MIHALLAALALKDEARTGWVLRGIREPESVADHSWGTALLVMLHAGDTSDPDSAGETRDIDRSRALEIAIVHDLAEAITGDVATRVKGMSNPEAGEAKRERERDAMQRLMARFPAEQAQELMSAWEEYEMRSTPEALFVRDMNLIDMCLQACRYEEQGRYDRDEPNPDFPDYEGLDEFFATTRPRLSTPAGKRLFEQVLAHYRELPRVAARGGPVI